MNNENRRLLFVVGKGGVGRTTVTGALAFQAAQQGKRVLTVEINGLWDLGRRLGRTHRSYEAVRLGPDVDWRSLSTRDCLGDFGARKLHLGRLGAKVMTSRPLRAFVDAVPGLPDLLQLGKIENLLNEPLAGETRYDLVIVDAPATGHGLSLLAAPQAMTDISDAGPFHELADTIATALSDGTTGIVVTTLPEHLPCTETLGLLDVLERGPIPVDALVVNKLVEAPLPDRALWPMIRAAQPPDPDLQRLCLLVDSVDAVAREQEKVLARLLARSEAAALPLHRLPWVPGSTPQTLAQHLDGR